MTHKTKIQHIKTFIKITIVVVVLLTFVVLGFFIKPNHNFENANMKKWATLNPEQKLNTVKNIVKDSESQDLLINCITKISELPDSENMQIRDATVLCYNGIKLNASTEDK